MKKIPESNIFLKSAVLAGALFAASPSCTQDCSPEYAKDSLVISAEGKKASAKENDGAALISAEQNSTRSDIEALVTSHAADLPRPFILTINGQELPLDKSELRLKKNEKATFELTNGPFNAENFFFCPLSETNCPLYDAVDYGSTTFHFTPDMEKPVQYRIGFCSSFESSCDDMVYRTITIAIEDQALK